MVPASCRVRRLFALSIDLITAAGIGAIVFVVVGLMAELTAPRIGFWATIVGYALGLGYLLGCGTLVGQTLGHRIAAITVQPQGRRARRFARELFKYALLSVNAFFVLFGRPHLGDRIAGTQVVRCEPQGSRKRIVFSAVAAFVLAIVFMMTATATSGAWSFTKQISDSKAWLPRHGVLAVHEARYELSTPTGVRAISVASTDGKWQVISDQPLIDSIGFGATFNFLHRASAYSNVRTKKLMKAVEIVNGLGLDSETIDCPEGALLGTFRCIATSKIVGSVPVQLTVSENNIHASIENWLSRARAEEIILSSLKGTGARSHVTCPAEMSIGSTCTATVDDDHYTVTARDHEGGLKFILVDAIGATEVEAKAAQLSPGKSFHCARRLLKKGQAARCPSVPSGEVAVLAPDGSISIVAANE